MYWTRVVPSTDKQKERGKNEISVHYNVFIIVFFMNNHIVKTFGNSNHEIMISTLVKIDVLFR